MKARTSSKIWVILSRLALLVCVGLASPASAEAQHISLQPQLPSAGNLQAPALTGVMRGVFLQGGLALGKSRSPQSQGPLGTLRQPMAALPFVLVGGAIVGVALITSLIGSLAAVVTKRGLIAWGVVSLISGTAGVVVGLVVLTLLPLSLPILIASAAVLALGVVDIMLEVKRRRRRRWRKLYGSKSQRTQDAIIAELAGTQQAYSTSSPTGLAIRF